MSQVGAASRTLAPFAGPCSSTCAIVLRYRLLLAFLSHFLQTEGPLLDENADLTARDLLNRWTDDEMRHMSQVAARLATLPRTISDPELSDKAGAPFELPYTLILPDREADRWRTHLNVLDSCVNMARSIASDFAEDANDMLLELLLAHDVEAQRLVRAAMAGSPLSYPEQNFQKVVRLLENGVRGFSIGVHHNFWRGCTRDQFVSMSTFDNPLIAVRPDGTYDAANSNLIKALRGEPPFDVPESGSKDLSHYPRMPARHPPLHSQYINYIANWIESGCPDSKPTGQVAISE